MKSLAGWLLMSTTLLLAGCSTFSVDSDFDSDFNFTKLQTYQWHTPNEYNEATKKYLANDILDKRIRENVQQSLEKSGYSLAEEGTPDFYVNYSVSAEPRVDVNTYNVYGGYAPGWYGYYGAGPYRHGGIGYTTVNTETRVTHYQQGTFILDIVDPKSGKLVWRGTAEGRIRKNTTQAQKEESIKEVVTKVLSNFPPK